MGSGLHGSWTMSCSLLHLQCAHLDTALEMFAGMDTQRVFGIIISGQGLQAWNVTAIEASEGTEKN